MELKSFKTAGGILLLGAVLSLSAFAASNVIADAAKGKEVFFGEKGECNSCHKLNGQGGSKKKKIPDLSNIGSFLTKEQIATKVKEPCKFMAEGYRDAWEEEVMPRNLAEILSADEINNVADFLSGQKDTKADTPKAIATSAEDQEEFC